jgi:hypothetical protein
MNEIILAPCDVISKIKQNSSDMNEIILASCDAGYVQSCTGFYIIVILRDPCNVMDFFTEVDNVSTFSHVMLAIVFHRYHSHTVSKETGPNRPCDDAQVAYL